MRVLLVATRAWGGALRAAHCALELGPGTEVDVATADPRPLFLLSASCSRVLALPAPGGPGAEAEAVSRLAAHVRARGTGIVVPIRVEDAKLLDAARPRLGGTALFPFSPPAVLDRLNNKWAFAGLCREAGVPIPATGLLERADDRSLAAPGGLGYPVVVKPLELYGSRGVRRVDDAAALRRHLDREGGRHGTLPLLAQEFVPGRDLGLNVLASEGRVLLSIAHHRTRAGHAIYHRDEEADEIGRRVAGAVGYTGIMNVDLRRDERTGRLVAFECNPRCWDSIGLAAWAGWNFVAAGLRHALGQPVAAHGGGGLPRTAFAAGGLWADALRRDWSWLRMSRRNLAGVARTVAELPSFAAIRLTNVAKGR